MAKRRSIHIAGFKHGNPIPSATRLGPLLVSSVIVGRDPATGTLPDSVLEQCVHIFAHVRAMLAEAGATPEDVVKMDFWVPDSASGPRDRQSRNGSKCFPISISAPRAIPIPSPGGGTNIQATFMAYIDRDSG